MPLSKNARSPHSPSPIYGIRPGFTVADFDRQYTPQVQAKASGSASDPTPTAVPIKGARAIKIVVNVTAGSGSVDVTVKSAVDSFVATVASYTGLVLGANVFYLGGWSSPDSDGSSYTATKYGPPQTANDPDADNPTGDQDTDDPALAASSNYMGGTYNPFRFLSLDGYDLKFVTVANGTVTYDIQFEPLS